MNYGLTLVTAPATEPVSLAQIKQQLRLSSGSLADDLTPAQSIKPGDHVVAAAYGLVGSSADVLGFAAIALLDAGTFGDGGTVDVKLQDSDDDATWADVTSGSFTQVTTANDETPYELAYTGTKQYLRAVATVAAATCDFGVTIIKSDPANAEDDLLNFYITAARRYCEGVQNRAYITQTWDMTLDAWPAEKYIKLPRAPLASITSVTYIDSDGTTNTMTASDYFAETKQEPGRLCLAYSKSWPTATLRPYAAITIRYVAGAATVKENTKHLIKLLVGHWYENREPVEEGRPVHSVPFTLESLIWLDRVF